MPPHRIPPALRDKFKGKLNRLENLRVLSKVDEPTSWVSSIVVRTKRSGQLRVCIDPCHLNRALKRETYQLPILNDLLPELSSIFDRGPHREILALRARWGIKSTHNFLHPLQQVQMEQVAVWFVSFKPNISKTGEPGTGQARWHLEYHYDILDYGVGAPDEEAHADHDWKLEDLLKRCREHGIALNKKKQVTFMHHVFTNKGLKIDPEQARAVLEMPHP